MCARAPGDRRPPLKLRKLLAMIGPDKIEDYLQRLTPTARSNLLTELERLEVCGAAMPGSAAISRWLDV